MESMDRRRGEWSVALVQIQDTYDEAREGKVTERHIQATGKGTQRERERGRGGGRYKPQV
jgi:hypothetical protein